MNEKIQILESVQELTNIVKSQKSQNKDDLIFVRRFNTDLTTLIRDSRSNPPSKETIENLISKLEEVQEVLIVNTSKRVDSVSSLVGVLEKIVTDVEEKPVGNQLH